MDPLVLVFLSRPTESRIKNALLFAALGHGDEYFAAGVREGVDATVFPLTRTQQLVM